MTKTWVGPVYLEPIEHVYIHRDTQERFSSVTQCIHSLVNPFDEEAVSAAIVKQPLSRKKLEYHNLTQGMILELWHKLNHDANVYGTMIHELIEEYLHKHKILFPTDPLHKTILRAYDALDIDEGETIWPERIMFSDHHKLAGTADLIIDIDSTFFDVGDWKTNRAFDFYDSFGHKTMKKPLDHLQDCHYSIYSVQLSIYAYMYELETGRKCRQIWIGYWDREKQTIIKIPILYLKNEAKKVLDWHLYNTQFA